MHDLERQVVMLKCAGPSSSETLVVPSNKMLIEAVSRQTHDSTHVLWLKVLHLCELSKSKQLEMKQVRSLLVLMAQCLKSNDKTDPMLIERSLVRFARLFAQQAIDIQANGLAGPVFGWMDAVLESNRVGCLVELADSLKSHVILWLLFAHRVIRRLNWCLSQHAMLEFSSKLDYKSYMSNVDQVELLLETLIENAPALQQAETVAGDDASMLKQRCLTLLQDLCNVEKHIVCKTLQPYDTILIYSLMHLKQMIDQ